MNKSTAHYIVTKIGKILIVNLQFHLEKLKHIAPVEDSDTIEVTVVNVTESQ